MPDDRPIRSRYRNPILDHDVPDPDAIALSTGGWALIASSFDRAPGLPLWRSDDLMTWTPVGHAGGYREDAPHDGGVWAPSLREHGGRLFIVWGDPDRGVLVVDAPALEGPWSPPRLVLPAKGIIDACPLWEDDGTARIVHGWARSRAGFANRLDVFEVDPALTRALGPSHVVIDGDRIEGCSTLEGPKAYRRDGVLWILAPAGGVATGWQYAFRAPGWDGPWEHRLVLEQGDSPVNGPHQGAWIVGEGGEEWFLHFQARTALGRVLHLQPLSWGADGWPRIGSVGAGGVGTPVAEWDTPDGGAASPPAARGGDDFLAERPSPAWHSRGTDPAKIVASVGGGRLVLVAHPEAALLRPLDGAHSAVEVEVLATDGAAAAFVIVDGETRELRLGVDGAAIANGDSIEPVAAGRRIGVRFAGGSASFLVDGSPVGRPFALEGRRWTGAEWGLAARGTGTATFGPVEVTL
ncbi:glycosyl hydrolase family 43 [Rathayibacter sp. PhB152]|uniref:family 43 glycosylhydrolase n=1 Tax=Rathayibacter sp. PhB152 TaxID=2485190 RepID=UPI000FC0BF62|nr:family 43 glycosylhydrolase [Rathayibacter sp. PhB152]ROQ64149.1 glycosyl hydrolase family 43 [Rathayibacter sp. PhB152]